ncbi:Probable dolichyl-diphosphooligosaccharide--protein glycosyltransferase subunit 3B [Linum perenne]
MTSSKTPRPYSLLVFLDAKQLHDKSELRLQGDLKNSLYRQERAPRQEQSLPHIRLISPDVKNPKQSEQMDQGDFSRMAESMAEFVESRTKISVGEIHRPPLFCRTQLGFIIPCRGGGGEDLNPLPLHLLDDPQHICKQP